MGWGKRTEEGKQHATRMGVRRSMAGKSWPTHAGADFQSTDGRHYIIDKHGTVRRVAIEVK